MADLSGKIIADRYRVDALLGRGGTGDVYKVWDNQRAAFLAMKVLHADLAEDKVFLRRFAREAETLSALQHPHIVRFYGLEQDGRTTFMLMDYVEGTTLRGQIFDDQNPFTVERVLQILRPVCSALHYAHKMGRIHCDIKPANIMIKTNGDVLVADFGIARMLESSTTITLAGAGTPAYMSPEQIMGKKPIPQTDLYALGIVMYEMLTGGERPFTGEFAQVDGTTSEKVRWEQLNIKPPTLRKYNPSIPQNLEEVVLKCLEKDTANRYADSLDLLQAFEKAYGNQQGSDVASATDDTTDEGIIEFSHGRQEGFEPTERIPYEKVGSDKPDMSARSAAKKGLFIIPVAVILFLCVIAFAVFPLITNSDISSMSVSPGISDLKIPPFAAGEDVYIYFRSDQLPSGHKFESRWFLKADILWTDLYIPVGYLEYIPAYGETRLFFHLKNPGIVGEYRVDIYMDQNLVGSQVFEIYPKE